MTITLSLSPETDQKLREQAAATGKDVATLICEAVAEKLAKTNISAEPSALPYEQWKAAFDAWVAGHGRVGHFVDDSRESIYAGRGE